MDPLTQGTLGAIASQNTRCGNNLFLAGLLGFLAGLSADLDILIRSESDPLLFLEYHRQFTHSLVFIPFGGLICAGFFYLIFGRRKNIPFRQILVWCTVGYATHALLDACTSYGTQLFWPFSNYRVSWNSISIIDPIFTLPLLGLVITAAVKRKLRYARYAAIWMILYLSLGVVQRERAESAGHALAQSRNHVPVRLEVKPGFGNLLLWKVIYETGNAYHVDGVRAGLSSKIYPGESIDKLNVQTAFPWLDANSQQAQDIERFRWFSDGFVAVDPSNSRRVIDIRYSMLPNEVEGLWMIVLNEDAGPDDHVGYAHDHRNTDQAFRRLVDMILGR